MDITAYISSGVLELYAAGALSAAEKAEVEALAQKYPEIQAELNQITQVYDNYASLHAVTPPASLKAKVLGAVSEHVKSNLVDASGNINTATVQAKVIPMRPERQAAGQAFKWLIAASVILLILSNALSFYFYRNWKNSENSLQIALTSQQQYAQQVQQVQQKLTQNEVALAIITDPSTQRVELKGVEKSPDSRVTVYWHKNTSDVFLSVNDLPEPPRDQQYQLWALADGKPIDAGLLDEALKFSGFQKMKDVTQAQAFAITLEPKGGSVAPTLDQMYVMGAI